MSKYKRAKKRAKKDQFVTRRELKKAIDGSQETKRFFTDTGAINFSNAGNIFPISLIANGDSDQQRIGDEVTLLSLDFTYDVDCANAGLFSASDHYNSCRVIIFQWHESSGLSAPSINVILELQSASDAELRLYRYDTRMSYTIVYDRRHTLFNTPVFDGTNMVHAHGYGSHYDANNLSTRKFRKKLLFSDETTYGSNHLYCMLVSDSGYTPHPLFHGAFALNYKDS